MVTVPKYLLPILQIFSAYFLLFLCDLKGYSDVSYGT